MKHLLTMLKTLFPTAVPVICCAILITVIPDAGVWWVILVGGVSSAIMAFVADRQIRSVVRRYCQRIVSLTDAVRDERTNEPVASQRIDAAAFASTETFGFIDPAITPFNDLTAAISRRIRTLLASNQDLSRSFLRFQSILATMNEGVLLCESDGRILYSNPAAGRVLGRKHGEIEGKKLWEVLRASNLESALEIAMSSGEELRHEFELMRTNSIVELSAVPLGVSSDAGMVIVLHNVTELRRLERMRRDFVSNVSHELKTPLTAIQAYADTLLDGGLEDADNSRLFVERIQQQADRLQQLIQDMLRLARIESQAEAFELKSTNVADVVESCLDARVAVARARQIDLTYQCDGNVVSEIVADEEGLRTIFDNLINNALCYTQEHGTVDVHCFNRGDSVCIDVTDNGIGIGKEHHGRIFERFYRVDRARSRGMGGTGLGLSIVKHCVDLFGGEIELESEPGKGTRFRVSFPVVKQSLTTPPSDLQTSTLH